MIAGLAVVLVADDAEPVEVAAAELVHVPDDPGFVELGVGRHVDVTLIDDGGTEAVRIDGADLPATGDEGDLELWFLAFRGDDLDIIPLGILEDPSDPGTFAVPDDFDRSAYDTIAVDISIEPRDGDEAHSGMSLVRGTLTA